MPYKIGMRSLKKALAAAVGFGLAALASPAARASDTYHVLSPGFLWSITKQINDEPAWGGIGGELTYSVLSGSGHRLAGFGAFAQVQTVGFHHMRAAVGPQFMYSVAGIELGPYIETAKDDYATTVGVQASPFVSVGVLSAAFRAGIPITTTSEGTRYGVDLGAVFTLKLPFAPGEELGYVPVAWTFAMTSR